MARKPTLRHQGIPHIEDADVKGRRVFLRCDLNVPIREGKIQDESRIWAVLRTLHYLLHKGAKVIVGSHLGRPHELKNINERRALSLRPVAERLSTLLGYEVPLIGEDEKKVAPLSRDIMSFAVTQAVSAHLDGEGARVALLENLRFWNWEVTEDPSLAAILAEQFRGLAQLYVNDAFGTCHREHCSIHSVADKFIGSTYGGFLLHEELVRLERLRQPKEAPDKKPEVYVVVLGGREIDHRCAALQHLKPRPDCFLIGGDCAYTFLRAQEREVGVSYLDDGVGAAAVIAALTDGGVQFELPRDVIVAADLASDSTKEEVKLADFPVSKAAFDIGPETRKRFHEILDRADRILWVGPMGYFTHWLYDGGTREIVKSIAYSDAYTVAGGADTMWAINHFGLAREFTHISTGGSAMLLYLSKIPLPGIEKLEAAGAAVSAGSGGAPRNMD